MGGGERYCLTLAETLLAKNWQVDLWWKDQTIKDKFNVKFGLNLKEINIVNYSPLANSLFSRMAFERKYDFIFYLSDGSLPFIFGKKNFLHFQVPFSQLKKKPALDFLKLERIEKVVCNSNFTKGVIEESLDIKAVVVYPPVDVEAIKPGKKENVILSVGRFSQLLQGKHQDILVNTFKKMSKKSLLGNWKLILAGGSEVGAGEFVSELRKMAAGAAIEIVENPTYPELRNLYGKAKIFWTASGYGADEKENPEKVEHFGISTVEAMAAGCVPIVMAKGGQKEIVKDQENGFWWQEENDLEENTFDLIKNQKKIEEIGKKAIARSRDFSKGKFSQNFLKLIA